MIYAAVDIGSNAARLMFANVFELDDEVLVEKATLVRIPTRLGEDVYTNNRITEEKVDRLIKTLKAYRLLIEAYNPVGYDACATAAMREATNGHEVLDRIKTEAGFDVRLIDGIEEANIIRKTNKIGFRHPDKITMYIDVGGGSTDISIMENNRILGVKSFKIGTLRLLKKKVKKKEWDRLESWLKEYKPYFGTLNVVGSGGNINKINKLYGDTTKFLLTLKKLRQGYDHLKGFTLEQRIDKLGLRPDRADVIVPAARIFLFIMELVKAKSILVPKIGLADGLIYQLYQNQKSDKSQDT
ncbi:MAG: exopolyphosphatase [Bacteroidetes bacterium]|nr:exopolyphosphatase [Bacteroidota bacterium]